MKYLVDYPNLVTKELFEVLKEFQLKKLYNTFIKPKKLVRYLFIYSYLVYLPQFLNNREEND